MASDDYQPDCPPDYVGMDLAAPDSDSWSARHIVVLGDSPVTHVCVAEYLYCCHESDWTIISVHLSAAGAYWAKKAHHLAAWDEAREHDLRMRSCNRKLKKKIGDASPREPSEYLPFSAWRVRKVPVLP